MLGDGIKRQNTGPTALYLHWETSTQGSRHRTDTEASCREPTKLLRGSSQLECLILSTPSLRGAVCETPLLCSRRLETVQPYDLRRVRIYNTAAACSTGRVISATRERGHAMDLPKSIAGEGRGWVIIPSGEREHTGC